MRTKLGQNFLVDKKTAGEIAGFLKPEKGDTIVEIGPGRGILTQFLVECPARIIAVEIDPVLCRRLEEKFKGNRNLEILNSDFMGWAPGQAQDCPLKYIGNLPYYMSTAIMEKVLVSDAWKTAVFTMQKEVAERLAAKPDTKAYGSLTLFAQFYSAVELLKVIPPACFKPEPKVFSSVVGFTPLFPERKYKKEYIEKLFALIKVSFSHRRKTLCNSLLFDENYSGRFSRNGLADILRACGIDENSRAENLHMNDYIKILSVLENR